MTGAALAGNERGLELKEPGQGGHRGALRQPAFLKPAAPKPDQDVCLSSDSGRLGGRSRCQAHFTEMSRCSEQSHGFGVRTLGSWLQLSHLLLTLGKLHK